MPYEISNVEHQQVRDHDDDSGLLMRAGFLWRDDRDDWEGIFIQSMVILALIAFSVIVGLTLLFAFMQSKFNESHLTFLSIGLVGLCGLGYLQIFGLLRHHYYAARGVLFTTSGDIQELHHHGLEMWVDLQHHVKTLARYHVPDIVAVQHRSSGGHIDGDRQNPRAHHVEIYFQDGDSWVVSVNLLERPSRIIATQLNRALAEIRDAQRDE